MQQEPKRLNVALGARSYDILIGGGLIPRAGEFIAPLLPGKRVIILSDAHVAPLYAEALAQSLVPHGIAHDIITVAAGEGSKSFATFERVMEQLLALKPDRKTTLIALGGGVVGDLTGFAASVLLRGVPFIQIPTSLLAQVDSSVGGKTGINSSKGKNLIGSFYQPLLVLADTDTLSTLPPRELRAGYAEIIKYGLILAREFYEDCLQDGAKVISGEGDYRPWAVLASCAYKAAVVKADERESNDVRALLNFGHTFGHALEAETGFSDKLLHGEAVAIGMVMACRLSQRLGLVGAEVEMQLANHLRSLGMKATPRELDHPWDAEKICAHFVEDKKAEGGALTFIVLNEIGKAVVARAVDPALAREVVASYL